MKKEEKIFEKNERFLWNNLQLKIGDKYIDSLQKCLQKSIDHFLFQNNVKTVAVQIQWLVNLVQLVEQIFIVVPWTNQIHQTPFLMLQILQALLEDLKEVVEKSLITMML